MSDETTLLPCPFCGGEAVLHPTYDMDTGNIDGWFAWCDNDTCECKPDTGQFFTEAEAIAAWNNRATHGTLTAERLREAIERHSTEMLGGSRLFMERDWQTIADELNARAGRACNMSYIDTYEYEWGEEDYLCKCSNCGRKSWEQAHNLPKFCGGCGAKVTRA